MFEAAMLIIVGICYLSCAVSYALAGNYGMALCFVCYAVANAGLWVAGGKL